MDQLIYKSQLTNQNITEYGVFQIELEVLEICTRDRYKCKPNFRSIFELGEISHAQANRKTIAKIQYWGRSVLIYYHYEKRLNDAVVRQRLSGNSLQTRTDRFHCRIVYFLVTREHSLWITVISYCHYSTCITVHTNWIQIGDFGKLKEIGIFCQTWYTTWIRNPPLFTPSCFDIAHMELSAIVKYWLASWMLRSSLTFAMGKNFFHTRSKPIPFPWSFGNHNRLVRKYVRTIRKYHLAGLLRSCLRRSENWTMLQGLICAYAV